MTILIRRLDVLVASPILGLVHQATIIVSRDDAIEGLFPNLSDGVQTLGWHRLPSRDDNIVEVLDLNQVLALKEKQAKGRQASRGGTQETSNVNIPVQTVQLDSLVWNMCKRGSSNGLVYTTTAKLDRIFGHDECPTEVTTPRGIFRTPRCIIETSIYQVILSPQDLGPSIDLNWD